MDLVSRDMARGEPAPDPACIVELFGVARLLAGSPTITLTLGSDATLGDVVQALTVQAPALIGSVVQADGHDLVDGYIFNRNGREFLPSLNVPVAPGDRLLLLASVAGGDGRGR